MRVVSRHAAVEVIDSNVAHVLAILKRRLANGGVFLEMRRRECAKSPGVRRRGKHVRALRKLRKRQVRAAQWDARDAARGR